MGTCKTETSPKIQSYKAENQANGTDPNTYKRNDIKTTRRHSIRFVSPKMLKYVIYL